MMSFVLLSAGLLVATYGQSAACEGHDRLALDSTVELAGVLKSGQSEHEVQGPFDYVYLELAQPVCVDAPSGDSEQDEAVSIPDPVSRIQIAGDLLGPDIPIGKAVTVAGTLFAAHTAWHAEDVLVDAARID